MTSGPWTSEQRRRLREGVALFNREEFFQCHEVLESVWLEASGDDKVFLQGLIQVAVSFYHLRRENFTGAGRLLRAAVEKLTRPAECRRWIDATGLLEALRPLLESIESGQLGPETPAPEIRFLSAS